MDSEYSHLNWCETARSKGGLFPCNIPLISDLRKDISRSYNVLIEEEGIALRLVI